jgi:hypothetical protein
MKLLRVDIPKSKLDTIPENEQVFFIQLTHFLNELNILQKCVIISSNGITSLNTAERKGQVSQAQFFIRTLAGKLNEGWEMLRKGFFSTQLSKKYEKVLSQAGEDSLSELKRYFSGKNNVNLIRKSFAFHYDTGKIKEEMDKIPQSEVLEMFISEHRGNCLYSFSDIMVNWAILNSIDPSNPQRAMEILIDEVAIKVSGWFQEFGGDCIGIIVEKYGLLDYTEVEIPEPPLIDDVRLPYFVKKTE